MGETDSPGLATVTLGAYAPAQCVLAIDGYATFDVTVNVLRTFGPAKPTGHIAGVFMGANGGLLVQSWAAANPSEQTTSFSTSSCAAASGLARNAAGETYVAVGNAGPGGSCQPAISKFAAGVTGSAVPIANVSIPNASSLGQLAIDGSGNVYVAIPSASAVEEYSPDLSTQRAVLSGSNTGLDYPVALAFDHTGNLYVYSSPHGGGDPDNTGNIAEFAPLAAGSNDVAPLRTLAADGYAPCEDPWGSPAIAVDASGDVFSTNDGGGITERGPGAGPAGYAGAASANGFALDGDRLYVSFSPYRGCLNQFKDPNSLGYLDVPNLAATPVPFVTDTSETSPQLITY